MKKIVVSGLLILVFIAYIIHQRTDDDEANVIPPANINQQTNSQISATPMPSSAGQSPTANVTQGQYKDGSYTGSVADAFYGNIQVKAVVSGGKITDVIFLQHPNDRSTSIEINNQAMPYLKQEAIAAQSASVDIVSGATDSSIAFQESLKAALSKAM